jgi:NADH:ubiquinone oxidoreductase subunit 4 (subunit M)
MLWTIQRVFHGPLMDRWEHLTDADHWWERVPLAAMVAAILIVGIFPSVLTEMIEPSARAIADRLS